MTSTTIVKTVSVVAIEPIGYVGSTVKGGNVTTPNTTVPATASAGDQLVMALSLNDSSRVLSDPTGVTGWNAEISILALPQRHLTGCSHLAEDFTHREADAGGIGARS